MTTQRVLVLGGTGFVGQHLVARLASMGMQVRVPSRHPERHRDLKILPEAELLQADIHDPEALRSLCAGVDAVIHLVGILNEPGRDGSGFDRVHTQLTRKALDAAAASGVRRFIHMSALKADMPNPPSHYLRSKAAAEAAVFSTTAFPVTVFRPSVIFGPGDSFMNRFADLLRIAPVMPLARAEARFAPVYVGDVVTHFVNSLDRVEQHGQGYELCGPRIYTLAELVRYTARVTKSRRWILPLPEWAGKAQASVLEFVPGKPLSRDNLASLSVDSVCSGSTLPCPTLLESIVPTYLGEAGRDARLQKLRARSRL